jgi:hypothetical protein
MSHALSVSARHIGKTSSAMFWNKDGMLANPNINIFKKIIYTTWAAAQIRVRQQLYHPDLPLLRCPLPPALSDEARAMIVLWIARERRVFEMEMRELEYLLGLRGAR